MPVTYIQRTLFLFFFLFLSVQPSLAQKKINWHLTAGVGAADMRDFSSTLSDIDYYIPGNEGAFVSYELESKPSFLMNVGVGVHGDFSGDGLLGWDAGLNLRSGGFRLIANLFEKEGDLTSQTMVDNLPEFGKWERFQYFALHMPLSLNYIPFEHIGFTFGVDMYVQLSANPSASQFPYGRLGKRMGSPGMNPSTYKHPFQLGGHLGVYAPLGDRIRLDVQFVSDLVPRLDVNSIEGAGEGLNFREMGVLMNVRYNLEW